MRFFLLYIMQVYRYSMDQDELQSKPHLWSNKIPQWEWIDHLLAWNSIGQVNWHTDLQL